MIQSLHLQKIRTAALFALVGLLVVSCGSYQQASYYDNDGIYSNGKRQVSVEQQAQRQNRRIPDTQVKKETNAYSDYFGQKADEFDEILDEEIFTDVDSYSTAVENDSLAAVDLSS